MTDTRTPAQILADHAVWLVGEPTGRRLVWSELTDDERADLRDADLRRTDLTGALLIGADLRDALLTGADLYWADLRDALLTGADLRDALLTGADLRGSDLRGAALPPAPAIPDIHRTLHDAITAEGCDLDMSHWHQCATTHCRAGWVVTLAGEAGRELEDRVGTGVAAALIYMASDPALERIPDWYASDEDAMEDIRRLAGV